MSSLSLFTSATSILADLKSGLPGYLADDAMRSELARYNEEIQSGPNYPTLSIKGKVFTLHKDGEATRLMRSEDEVLQNIQVTVLRANPNARVFYAKKYSEGDEGEAARPDCYTNNGKVPASDAREPQSHKCAICPHAVWGTGQDGVGTACKVNTRLAIVAPEMLASGNAEPTLLRLPAGSRANFADLVKAAKRHGSPYFAAVAKVGFDPDAPAPKLTFKLMGYLNDAAFSQVRELMDSELVREIVGLDDQHAAPADASESAAVTAKAAMAKARAKPAPTAAEQADDDGVIDVPTRPAKAAPAPAPVEEDDAEEIAMPAAPAAPAPAPAPKPAAKKTAAKPPKPSDDDDMLGNLDALLSMPDD